MAQVETEVKERPILFSGAMVRAILDGKKTQTRRAVKPAAPYVSTDSGLDIQWVLGDLRCPYGEAGDRLWVRESFRCIDGLAYNAGESDKVAVYRADDTTGLIAPGSWQPSIHMPRWASRLTLEIKSVRVERVKDISEADAKAEGVIAAISKKIHGWTPHVLEYSLLWDSINAKRTIKTPDGEVDIPFASWEANPWVWVVEFERA